MLPILLHHPSNNKQLPLLLLDKWQCNIIIIAIIFFTTGTVVCPNWANPTRRSTPRKRKTKPIIGLEMLKTIEKAVMLFTSATVN